jgi:hypothetical protein
LVADNAKAKRVRPREAFPVDEDEEERARVMVYANVRLVFEYAIFRPSGVSHKEATTEVLYTSWI